MERISLVSLSKNERRSALDKGSSFVYLGAAFLAASSLVIIAIFLFYEGLKPFFTAYTIDGEAFRIDVWAFLSGLSWYGYPAASGILFLVINTIWVSFLALLVALPLSVLTSLFITRIAPRFLGMAMAFVVELLSAIPSVVYGLFGRGIITSSVSWFATLIGIQSKGGLSVLAGGLVLAIMIMPIITTLSVNAMKTVPEVLIASSLALGASPTETNFKIVVRKASNGIFAGTILGLGRALGEATAISMVVGNAGTGPTFDLFGITSTLTTTMLLGYSEAEGINAEIRFSLGLALILLIIGVDALLALLKKLKDCHDGLD
jgi:phosphate transport system permease protein